MAAATRTVKTDAQLQRDVAADLEWDAQTRSQSVGVTSQDGIITVSGTVDTWAQRQAAASAAMRVAGVNAVAVELEVRLAIPHHRSDTEIAATAADAVRSDALIPAGAVRIEVERGCLTLEGDVAWDFQRRAAERAVQSLIGVVEVRNLIRLQIRPAEGELVRRIEAALERQALHQAHRIQVVVDGTTVKLSGLVNSWHERDAIERVAWSAPGVHDVVNELLSA